MFTVNGSVKTEGPDNWLPIDTFYNFKRYACRYLIHVDEIRDYNAQNSYDIIDHSAYNNLIIPQDINIIDTDVDKSIASNHYFGKKILLFNGKSSYLASPCNNIITLNNSSFTISLWMQTNYYSLQNSKSRHLFILGDANNNIGLAFEDNAGNAISNVSVIITTNGVKTGIYNTTQNCADNDWHHLLICRDLNNIIRYYIDGIYIDKVTNDINIGHSQNSSLYLGCYLTRNSGFYNGVIDEFYILNGLSEKVTDVDFDTEIPQSPYLIQLESEKNYSGMTFHGKLSQNVSKYDLVCYDPISRAFQLADITNPRKMPIKGIALESGITGNTIEILAYGTIVSNANEFIGEKELEYTSSLPIYTTSLGYNQYNVLSTSGDATKLFNIDKKLQKFIFNESYWELDTAQGSPLNWLRIKLPNSIYVKSYSLTANTAASAPTTWKLKGSNDKINWTLLDYQVNINWNVNETKEFNVINLNKSSFKYYEFYDCNLTSLTFLKLYNEFGQSVIPDIDETGEYLKVQTIGGESTGHEAYHLFDGQLNTYWQPVGSFIIGDILIDFGMWYEPGVFEYADVEKIAITCNNNFATNKHIYVPFEFVFLGSNDNNSDESKWNLLYSYKISDPNDSVWTDYNDRVVFDLLNNNHYRYYKLSIKQSNTIKPLSCTTNDYPTDFQLPKLELLDSSGNNIIPVMTSNRCLLNPKIRKYEIIESVSADQSAYLIFNGDTTNDSSGWYISSFDPSNPPYFILDFGQNEWIKQYFIQFRTQSSDVDASPKSWKFYGSDDNLTWIELDDYTSFNTNATSAEIVTRTLLNSVHYRYYKFEILDTFDNSQGLYIQDIGFKTALNQSITLPIFTSNIATTNINYFEYNRATFGIRSSDEKNNNYYHIRNLINDTFIFNICSDTSYQWTTNDNVLTPWVIFDLPELCHSEYDRRIDGYTIISLINVNDHQNFRAPRSWIVRGFDGLTQNWIELDHKINVHFRDHANCFNELESGGVKLNFTLSQTYITLTKIQFEILDSEGSTKILAPNYIGLKAFYPTYNGCRIEIPRFTPGNVVVAETSKYLNYYSFGVNDFTWEFSSSSNHLTDANYQLNNLFNDQTTTGWTVTSNEDVLISTTQYGTYSHVNSAVEIKLNIAKRIDSYGVYYSQLALSGLRIPATRWILKGSNDNINWDVIDAVGPITDDMILKSYPMIFKVNTDKSYKIFKFDELNGGYLHGIEFYEKNTISDSKSLTCSIDNPGKVSTYDLISNYSNRLVKHYIQNIGYTGLKFSTADEEYSVKYFDFNNNIEVKDPNLGDLVITSDPSDPYYNGIGHSIENGPMITVLCNTLQIQNNAILTTKVPCRGLRIIVLHDCVIDGTIHMTGKGAAYSPLWTHDFPIYDYYGALLATVPRYGANGGIFTPTVAGVDVITNWKTGAASATVQQALRLGVPGKDGLTIIDALGNNTRATGGGGSGSAIAYTNTLCSKAGDGGRGSCFSGGAGGAGCYVSNVGNTAGNPYKRYTAAPAINDATLSGSSFCSNNRQIYGCNTSTGYTATTNASVGLNSPGAGPRSGGYISGFANSYNSLLPTANPTFGNLGAGGLLILIVYGNLYTSISGKIQSNGSAAPNAFMPACGGGSGGGSVNIFVGGIHINNGVYEAVGGAGGVGYSNFANIYTASNGSYLPGGSGGNGTVTITYI